MAREVAIIEGHTTPAAIPVSLILAIITRESGGEPGRAGRSSDDGLMQVKPAVVQEYNKRHAEKISHAAMRGTDQLSARKQIKVGTWYILHCLKLVNSWNPIAAPWPYGPLTDYQIRLADLCYARGGPGTKKLRARALGAGYPDTFEGIELFRETHDPTWGTPGRPFKHAAAVLRMTRADGTGSTKPPAMLPAKDRSFMIVALVGGLIWAATRKR